jgi:hypothetical protein
MTLWRLLPRLVWRYRRLLLSVMVAAAMLGAASSVGPLFLESSERQALAQELGRRSRFGLGLQITFQTSWPHGVSSAADMHRFAFAVRAGLRRRFRNVEGVDRPIVTFLGSDSVASRGATEVDVRLIHRTGALDQVTKLGRVAGRGVWISDVTARDLAVAPGDTIRLAGEGGSARTRVAGVYRFLPRDRERGYWIPLSDFIDKGLSADTFPPSFVIASRSHHLALIEQLRDSGELRWEVPLAGSLSSLTEAKRVQRSFRRETAIALGPSSALGSLFRKTRVGLPPQASSVLPGSITSIQERVESITPAVDLLAWTARLLALCTLAVAGFYVVRRRREEINLLAARGLGPLPQVLRLMTEAALPLLLGAAVGMVSALFVISWIGSGLPWSSFAPVWRRVWLDLCVGWVVMGMGLGAAIHNQERALATGTSGLGPRKGRTIGAIAGAVVAIGGLVFLDRISGDKALLDTSTIAGPVLVMIGASLLGAFAAGVALARVTHGTESPIVLLGLGRLPGAAFGTFLLIAACAASLGVLVYALTVRSSLEATVVAKAKVFVGSDVAASVGRNTSLGRPLELALPSTEVVRVPGLFIQPADREVEVIAVDADTFAEAAYWDGSFSEQPLADLLALIATPRSDSTPAIMVGATGDGSVSLGSSNLSAPLDVVATVEAWPGMSGRLPLVVVERDQLQPLLAAIGGTLLGPDQQVWARASGDQLELALKRNNKVPLFMVDSDTALASPTLQAMRWTLGVLIGLALTAGVLSVAGLMLNLESRHKTTMLAAVLGRRMGLTGRRELTVYVLEIAATIALSYGVALLTAVPLSQRMNARMDLRPAIPPDPIFVLPAGPLLAAACLLAVIAVGLSVRLQRTVDRAHVPGLLRA